MPDVLTDAAQLTPDWLTQALRAHGALDSGQVTNIRQRSFASKNASVAQVEASYSADAGPSAPRRLFLKLGRRRIEVELFNHLAPSMPDPPLPRCYAAVFDPDLGRSHLLFDDLSATHVEAEEAIPPALPDSQRMLDALAQIHAHWWQHPRLHTDIKAIGEDVPGYVVAVARERFPAFADLLGDRLSEERRRIYDMLFALWPPPDLRERLASERALTIIHGDTHFWNFLLPRDPRADTVRILDWAVWHIGIGPTDLAYMLAMFWFPERRARMEQGLVRRYHAQLLARGVQAYDWEQCWLDYRAAAIFNLFWPVFWSPYLPQAIWWNALEKAMLAFEDLECEELLE
jgi:hypothetical protein